MAFKRLTFSLGLNYTQLPSQDASRSSHLVYELLHLQRVLRCRRAHGLHVLSVLLLFVKGEADSVFKSVHFRTVAIGTLRGTFVWYVWS